MVFELRFRRCVAVVCGLAAMLGCGDEGVVRPPAPGSVTLRFDHQVAGQPLRTYELRYTNAAGNLYSVSKLAYYVSDVRLRRGDGSEFVVGAVHYCNAESISTRDFALGDVPDGTYTALVFTFGLNEARNVTGGLPSSLWHDMAWPETWGGGYHYMQMEGRYADSTGSASIGYATHTGRRRLASDPAPYHHFFTVTLPLAPLVVQRDAWRIGLTMDIDEWYRGPHVYDLTAFGPNIMIDLYAQSLLMENGADVFSMSGMSRLGP